MELIFLLSPPGTTAIAIRTTTKIKDPVLHPCESFPGGSDSKASAYSAADLGSVPGLGRSPGGGNGNPL